MTELSGTEAEALAVALQQDVAAVGGDAVGRADPTLLALAQVVGEAQLERLEVSLARERQNLSTSEAQYRDALGYRNKLRASHAEAEDRLAEISEMLARFSLLEKQYSIDLLRLESIREAGQLFFALPSENCPVCGATPDYHDPNGDCDASTEAIVAAAATALGHIARRHGELDTETVFAALESAKRTHASLQGIIEDTLDDIDVFT